MENSHFIHRVHNAGNYVLGPEYEGEGDSEILNQLKSILGDTVTEWKFEQADTQLNPCYRLLVNGKPIHVRVTVQPNVYDDRCIGIRFDGDDVLMVNADMNFELSYFDDNLYLPFSFDFFTNYTKEFLLNH